MTDITKIALCGKLRSGKDAVGSHLFVHHGFEFPIAFGTALKSVAHAAFPWIPRDPKPRELYQLMNVMREFDPDVWIKHLDDTYRHLADQRSTTGIVVTDVRQPNEYEWCRANGFTIIRVTAPEAVRMARAQLRGDDFTAEDMAHSTESYVDGFDVDYEVENDGTYDDLKAKVNGIIKRLRPSA